MKRLEILSKKSTACVEAMIAQYVYNNQAHYVYYYIMNTRPYNTHMDEQQLVSFLKVIVDLDDIFWYRKISLSTMPMDIEYHILSRSKITGPLITEMQIEFSGPALFFQLTVPIEGFFRLDLENFGWNDKVCVSEEVKIKYRNDNFW